MTVDLSKSKLCRAGDCVQPQTSWRVRLCSAHVVGVEQRLALGDLPSEIGRRYGAPLRYVVRVADDLDAVAAEIDNPRYEKPASPERRRTHCKRGHLFSPDNIIPRRDDRVECLVCKRERDRRYLESRRVAS